MSWFTSVSLHLAQEGPKTHVVHPRDTISRDMSRAFTITITRLHSEKQINQPTIQYLLKIRNVHNFLTGSIVCFALAFVDIRIERYLVFFF